MVNTLTIVLVICTAMMFLSVQEISCPCSMAHLPSNPVLKDVYIDEGSLEFHLNIPAVMMCYKKCLRHNSCISFFSNTKSRTCRLHSVKFFTEPMLINAVQFIADAGSRYFVLKEPSGMCTENYIWDKQLNKCYRFIVAPIVIYYVDARQGCSDDGGGDLIVIDSVQFRANIATQAISNNVTNKSGYFVGATDVTTEGEFIWIDGTPVDDKLWAPTYPKGQAPVQDYGIISRARNWFLQDIQELAPKRYICEIRFI